MSSHGRALRALIAAAFLLNGRGSTGQTPASSPQPRFPGQVDLVTVDVVVLEKGEPLRGLTARRLHRARGRAAARDRELRGRRDPGGDRAGGRSLVRSRTSTRTWARRRPPGRSFVIVLDNIHLDPAQADRAKAQVAEFVRTGLQPGDQVLFLASGGGAWWKARLPEGAADLVAAVQRVEGLRPARVGPDTVSDFEAIRIHQQQDEKISAEVSRRFYENGVLATNMPSGMPGTNGPRRPRADRGRRGQGPSARPHPRERGLHEAEGAPAGHAARARAGARRAARGRADARPC